MALLAVQAGTVWNPLSQQFVEPDTTFLLDPDADAAAGLAITRMYSAAYGPAIGGLLTNDPTRYQLVAGKYRKAVQSLSNVNGQLWIPADGILGASEFTIELWALCSADWASLGAQEVLTAIGQANNFVRFVAGGGSIQFYFQHQMNPANLSYQVLVQQAGVTVGMYPASTWVHLAATLLGGVLTLYVNGVVKGTTGGVVSPPAWGSGSYIANELTIGGSVPDGSSTHFSVSDLRTSTKARVPGQTLVVPSRTVVSVTSTPTGATVQPLTGTLHCFTYPPPDVYFETGHAAEVQQFSQRAVPTLRTDNLLATTPIKAGGTDGSHPTAGHSGSYSYDWQAVDRLLTYLSGTLGVEPYISLSSVPQLLGGTNPPFSGTTLTSQYGDLASYNPGPPSSNSAYATMCADLVYHIVVEKGVSVPYWGLWNEPDGAAFWETGGSAITDYIALYAAVANAIHALGLGVKTGGPEVAGWVAQQSWIHQLITYCGANSVPLDFISWHYYSGDTSEFLKASLQIQAWCTTAGIAMPQLINGEWSYDQNVVSNPPFYIPGTSDYQRNDHMAGFVAESLIQMQANGVVRAISTDPTKGRAANLFDSSSVPQVSYNVARMWSMLGATVLTSTVTGDPGVQAIASKDGSGKIYVLISCLHYRKLTNYPVLVKLPGTVTDGTTVATYIIDDGHSNAWDAGTPNANLQNGQTTIGTQGAGKVSGGAVGINLRPRSAALLVIG